MPSLIQHRPSIAISLHPAAMGAYAWLQTYPLLIDHAQLPASLCTALMHQPLSGVMTPDNRSRQFQMFCPLLQPRFWFENRVPDETLLIHYGENEISDEQIEKFSWSSALSHFLFSVNEKNLASVRDSLQTHMPEYLHRKLFSAKKITDQALCQWTGKSRSTFIQQRNKTKSQSASTEIKEAYAELMVEILGRAWNKDGEQRD